MRTLIFTALLWLPAVALAAEYDPLKLPTDAKPKVTDFVVSDSKRSRDIPIRVYLPNSSSPAPVVLFSHGLGGSKENSSYLGNHWASRGYVAVFMQHAGSDEKVWKSAGLGERMTTLKKAASLEQYLARVQDVPAVLDRLTQWNQDKEHALKGRLDLEHVGMSGHSFGAVTTQAVSGQSLPTGRQQFTDPRIKAAVIMSPSPPQAGDPAKFFNKVEIPWLLMTGTKDNSPIGDVDPKSRLLVYPALPKGDKFELVLDGGSHYAFSERVLPIEGTTRNPNHHKAILALSTAFWDAYLKKDEAA